MENGAGEDRTKEEGGLGEDNVAYPVISISIPASSGSNMLRLWH